jgi:hypothetical protein
MRALMPLRLIALIAGTVVAAAGATSCATTISAPSGPGRHSQSGSLRPISSQATSTTPSASVASTRCPGGWRTRPLTVTHHVAVPPVPVATAIRAGSHPGCHFDRLVLDIKGATPGYHVRFVAKVVHDGSGQPIKMPGTTYLVITLKPAQGHSASGTPTLPTGVHKVSDPMLKGYAVSGDFDGVLSVALGLAGGHKYRVGELAGRIYVDVAW